MPTTIQVDEETADELHARKDRGDSYDDVVRRLLGIDETGTGNGVEDSTDDLDDDT